ncbi:NAD(P)H-dependent oxidoreductase, partial [Chromobacterium piscinae]
MKLLHLDSSILADNSVTRELSAVVADTLRQRHANVETSYRDLAANPIAHLSGEIVGARFAPESDWTATQRSEAALSEQLIEEFIAADVLVIGAPM